MIENDKPEFGRHLRVLFEAFEIDSSIEMREIWWRTMQSITVAEFASAVAEYLTTGTARPRPAHILRIARPPKPDPDQLVAMARARYTPIGVLAYSALRDWLDQPWFDLRQRAAEWLERYDYHAERLTKGHLNRHERHYMRHYLPEVAKTLPRPDTNPRSRSVEHDTRRHVRRSGQLSHITRPDPQPAGPETGGTKP